MKEYKVALHKIIDELSNERSLKQLYTIGLRMIIRTREKKETVEMLQ